MIDDDENVRDTIAVMLEQEGFKMYLAADGQAGLDSALKFKPDLILVDLRLPGLPGMEICKRLRAAQMKSAIIVLPFVMLLVDFGARFLARFVPGIVYLMLASGACIGLLFAVMILVPLYEMWIKRA